MAHDCSRFRVGRSEHHRPKSRIDHRPCTHSARLERDVERAFVKAPRSESGRSVAERKHLGVGDRVAGEFAFVVSGGNDVSVVDDHGTYGDVIVKQSGARFIDRLVHPSLVLVGHQRSLALHPRLRWN